MHQHRHVFAHNFFLDSALAYALYTLDYKPSRLIGSTVT